MQLEYLINSADESFKDFTDTYAIVDYTGHTLWMFPAVIKTYCTFDVRHFPFDQQKCDVVFISWTFSGAKLDLLSENASSSIYYKPKNQVSLEKLSTVLYFVYYESLTFTALNFNVETRGHSIKKVVRLG